MLDRIARIVRSEIGAIARGVRRRWSRVAGGDERFDPPRSVRAGHGSARGGPSNRRGSGGPSEEVRRAFAALELPVHASCDEIRHAYRALMSRYHPDRHATRPDREAVATELSRRLTEAYERALAYAGGREAPTAPRPRSPSG